MQRDRRYGCRLAPYSKYHLPPCEQQSKATLSENSAWPECNSLTLHNVSEVRGIPSCVGFTVLQEWPIPWDMILTNYEMFILKKYMSVCLCCATIDVEITQLLHGYERWLIHCHCQRPGSLQCMSAGMLLGRWFKMAVYGTLINKRCFWYREVVNRFMPKEIMYVGSTFVRGRHLIYVKIMYDGHAWLALEKISFGWSTFNYGILNNMLVLCCDYCKDLSEIRMRCCARRTRLLMLKVVKVIAENTVRPLKHSWCEGHRQRLLKGLIMHHQAILFGDYNHRENPWAADGH
ncbi:E4 ORF5 [Human adenovirus 61]|nr:E4 ORF5 [Human adenovirus 61]